jgi:hypothetical protein
MRFNREELTKLAAPLLIFAALVAAGLLAILGSTESLRRAKVELAGAQATRSQNSERLARIAEEEREVREKLEVYRNLKRLNIIGEERRLEWADSLNRIRAQRELLDMRYRVDRQKMLVSLPGKPGNVEFYASTMHVDLALLHEEDLLRFLSDLRESGNAYYSVKKCSISRTGAAVTGSGLVPRLRAGCDIDLITVIDRGARQ